MKDLIEAIKKRSLEFGDFKLRSGKKSNFYLDLRKLTISEDVGLVIGPITQVVRAFEFDAIGGPTVGADPIVGAFLHARGLESWKPWNSYASFSVAKPRREIRGFLIRKESKDHGKEGLVIGSVKKGDRCVVVEDVTTTGGSLLHAISVIEEERDCKVVHAITIVDRQEGAREMLSKANIPFTALVTKKDLGIKE